MLVEFWDFCRPNSMRTLPYVKAWHERYADAGLRVIGVHCPGFDASRDEQAVRGRGAAAGHRPPGADRQRAGAVAGVRERGLAGALPVRRARAPVRVPLRRGRVRETELAIQELLEHRARAAGAAAPRGRARRDARGADRRAARAPTAARTRPAACGRCSTARGPCGHAARRPARRELPIAAPGAYPLLEHERHTAGVLTLELGDRRALPGDVLHARPGVSGRASRCMRARHAPRRRELRACGPAAGAAAPAAPASSQHARAGPVGLSPGVVGEEDRRRRSSSRC